MAEPVVSKSAEGSFIQGITIKSNKGGETVGLDGGFLKMFYRESIMTDTISIDLAVMDTGNTVDKKNFVDGLPVVGGESVSIKFEDNNKNVLDFGEKKNNFLYVNKLTPLVENSKKSGYMLSLTSKEYIINEKIRLPERFDGKISETVRTFPEKPQTSPGFGIKFLRDGMDSADTVTMFSFDGQPSFNYFKNRWSTHLNEPMNECSRQTIGKKLAETTDHIGAMSVMDWG